MRNYLKFIYVLSIAIFVNFALISCKSSDKEITRFVLYYNGLKDSVVCDIADTLITGIIPLNANRQDLFMKINLNDNAYLQNGKEFIYIDLRIDSKIEVLAEDGSAKVYAIKLKYFTGIPIVYINTEAPIVSKDNYVKGSMTIDGNLEYIDTNNYSLQIKGRGNSTWGQPKKPYKIKLDNKSIVLGMPADKEWGLLANYFDKSLIRNDVAFELSERLGLAWTPRRRFVELVLNGQYDGNYLLTELVKTSKDRIDIKVMNDKDSNDVSNGFVAEANYRMDEKQNWETPSGVRMSMKEPELLSPKQFAVVRNTFQNIEDKVSTYKDIRSDVDLDSWIKWVIVNEVMRNRDAVLFGSCYFYKNDSGRLAMGPVWDVDLSAGSYDGNVYDGWYIHTANWIGGLFLYQPYYKARFKEIWNQYKTQITTLPGFVQDQSVYLKYSQVKNYQRWDNIATPLFDGQIVAGSYDGEVNLLKNFIEKRVAWMDSEISKW